VAAAGRAGQVLVVSETDSFTAPNVPTTVARQFCVANCPVALSIMLDGNIPALTWNAEANTTYSVQYKEALGGVWQSLPAVRSMQEGFLQATDPTPALGTRFYRVQRMP